MIPAVSETASARQQLRILFVEDSLADAELCLRELRKAGFDVTADVVQAPEEFDTHVSSNSYDLVLADYNLPHWTGIDALKHLQKQDKGIPFILVTGTLGEETAVECIKQGATNYVLKDGLTRLPVAVRHALEEKALRDERKRTEQKLRLQATALESAANGILITDREGTIIWANPAFTFLTGYTLEEVIGQNPRILKSGTQDPSFYESLWSTILAGQVWWGEVINRRKDGSLYTEDQTITPVRDENGEVSYFVAVKQDISERKRMEEALRESETRFRTLAQGSPVGIFRTDATGHCIFLNERGGEITGLSPEAAIGYSWTQRVHPDDRDRVLAEWNTALEKNLPFGSEYRFEHPDGGTTWVFGQALPEKGPAGEITSYVGTITDITERKRAEEELQATQLQLIQSARFESVGQLAAGVAHEVKNPLTIIQFGLGYLSQALPTTEDDNVAQVLEKMEKAVKRADRVIKGLLDFSASSTLKIMPGDLNAVVEQSLLLVHYETVRAHVTVVKAPAKTLPPINLDRHKIEQVFVNVFINAIQAMPGGGTLTVKTAAKAFSALHPGVKRRRTDSFPSGATVVVVEVDDTGTGIPAESLHRVFDPFFTTKPIGEGTGLGLSVTQKIMELHGGIIDIRNRREGGVRVTLVFPADGGQDDGQETNTAH